MLLLRFLPPFPANYFSNVYLKKIYLAKTLNFLISIKGALHMSLQLVWMRSYSKYNGKITFQVHSLVFHDFFHFHRNELVKEGSKRLDVEQRPSDP